jgi:hypothetical protein
MPRGLSMDSEEDKQKWETEEDLRVLRNLGELRRNLEGDSDRRDRLSKAIEKEQKNLSSISDLKILAAKRDEEDA